MPHPCDWETEWTAAKLDDILAHVPRDTPDGALVMAVISGCGLISASLERLTAVLAELVGALPEAEAPDEEPDP
jgi:hypothetical protein